MAVPDAGQFGSKVINPISHSNRWKDVSPEKTNYCNKGK
jgi:hypothetical protein